MKLEEELKEFTLEKKEELKDLNRKEEVDERTVPYDNALLEKLKVLEIWLFY